MPPQHKRIGDGGQKDEGGFVAAGPVIGIDLGTACSCVAAWQHGRVEIVIKEHGGRTTPSYVAFTDTERLVGDAAKNEASRNPTNTVSGESV
ncbi:hypothetical protein E2562_021531 [Oryza meyeriana var. granulata]|uniref:Uncharacterized protein n=1 Tax=Oryza meyeriana var. granulata TaxID=110450 RepID=A0A6G1DZ70_9ORYZ|nr:hypothetical protein E2562_021531 [Oryza meyeriana var. granulata]